MLTNLGSGWVIEGPAKFQTFYFFCWEFLKYKGGGWFDALVFDPRFGGQNCLSVAQALQAELVNLMAMRQNLRIQIGVCWL